MESKRFCVAVRRKNYPSETGLDSPTGLGLGGGGSRPWIQPAHTITFLSPVVVVNLLPCHLIYKFKGSVSQKEWRHVKKNIFLADNAHRSHKESYG